MLFYGIEAIVAAGIRDIGIVVGDTQAEIRAAVGDGSRWGVRVEYIEQDAPRGLAHAVKISQPFIGDEPFVMYLGDNLLNKGITHFVEEFAREKPAAQILLARVPDPQMFGVAELRDGKVVRLVEKPKEPIGDLALVGVYMFGPEVFESVNRIKPSFRNELEITDAIQDLIDRGLTVRPHIVDGWWKDTGKLEDMLEANRLILDIAGAAHRRVGRRREPRRRKSRHRGRARWWNAPSSAVRRSSAAARGSFTPTSARSRSIGNDVEIQDSEIEHSIVLEGSCVRDLSNRVIDSLIGKNVRIYRDSGQAERVPVHAGRQFRGRHQVVT